jgi:glycerophosphoryl diester phosphodiesterase
VLLVAHRTPGTRVGCERLAAAGAQVFEADVQVDDADRVVVSHYLPFGRRGLVQRDNWRVRWHRAAAHDPRLADVTELIPDGCLVLLDLKEKAVDRRARLRSALISGLPDRDRFRVCTQRADDLAELRAAGFRTWRTARSGPELTSVLAESQLHDEAVSVRHTLLTAETVERLHRLVPTVVAWTVNDRRRSARLAALGVDGITTDSFAVLRQMNAIPH